MNEYDGNFEMVNPRLIVVDHRYQRQPKQTLIQQIAQHPSWLYFGAPICFKRKTGVMYCVDGQQRIAGILLSEKPPKEIPVIWFDISDVKDEAEVFVRINEWRKSLMPIEKHRGKIMAGDEAALAQERAVSRAGFTLDVGTGTYGVNARTISAVAGVGVIYNRIGEEGLFQTLIQIRDAWPDDGTALKTHVLRGVAELIEEQGESYNRPALTRSLRKTTPSDLLRKAEELKFKFGGSKMTNVRAAFSVLCGLKMPKEQEPKASAEVKAAKRRAAAKATA